MNIYAHISSIAALFLVLIILVAGCTAPPEGGPDLTVNTSHNASADELYSAATCAYSQANYRMSAELFFDAYQAYVAEGALDEAQDSLNNKFNSERMIVQFPLNRTDAERAINKEFPSVRAEQRSRWIEEAQYIWSDGEMGYFEDITKNIYFRNLDLIREKTRNEGFSPIYDNVKHIVFGEADNGDKPYFNPVTYGGIGHLSIPRDLLPETGMLRLWVPLPIETESQTNITILSIEPEEYLKKPPETNGNIGIAYLEIPLEDETSDVDVAVQFSFTEYRQSFIVNPDNIEVYDTTRSDYITYTASQGNTRISPEIRDTAYRIVGNETNPYLQAEMIYDYIVGNISYSFVPHVMLDTAGIPESVYVHEHGYGDCGAQSMYFSTLCRALGIPSRTMGGMQLIPGTEGDHFWAEFYLPPYGWIPVDTTVAETVDWAYNATENERIQFKDYYFGNLDPYRFVIQKDVDIPLDPDPGDAVMFTTVRQYPGAVCEMSESDIDLIVAFHWTFDVNPVSN
jgi:transglutaminase-like putative cysteine protease